MTPYRTTERTSGVYTATLVDEADDPVALSDLTALTLSLFDQKTGTTINSRSGQSILNTNQGTYHATSGLLTWAILPADMAITNTGDPEETHIAEFSATWSSGAKRKTWRVAFVIENLSSITS